jgi:hypothetical protein
VETASSSLLLRVLKKIAVAVEKKMLLQKN